MIFFLRGGGSTAVPIRGSTWCKIEVEEQLATSEGAVLYQLMSTYQNLHSTCTVLCPYPSTFPQRRGKLPVKSRHKHVLNGYWGVLWKKNYVVWIALETWLNVCSLHAPDMCKVYLTSEYELCFCTYVEKDRIIAHSSYYSSTSNMTYVG